MLENPEARAKLRHKLETWPDDRKSPVTINQALELLDLVERLEQEKEAEWHSGQLILGENSRLGAKADYLKSQYEQLKEKYTKLWDASNEIMGKAEKLEKEVNWLADELIMSELKKCPICDCPQKAPDIPTEADSVVFWNGCRKCWLEAARKAVEQQNERK